MPKSYLFLALVLGLVLVQTYSAKALPGKKSSSDSEDSDDDDGSESDGDDTEDEDEDEDEENEENPAPSCLLFGDIGCHVQCSVVDQAYDVHSEGHCDSDQTCYCHYYDNGSFHELWDTKFDSDYVYRKLNEKNMAHNEAVRIFDNPFQTAEEYKQLFKSVVSPYQFSKLETNDQSMAAKFTEKGLDEIDAEAVQKYVSEKVGKLVKTSAKSLLAVKYKDNFRKALKDAEGEKGTLYNLTYRVHQLKNKNLEDILREYLKKNNLEEPKVDVNDGHKLTVFLNNAVTNEIIKLNDEHSKAAVAKKKTPTAKKAPAKNTAKPKPAAKKA